MSAQVLDPCCGSRMMWFDKDDDRAVFGDIRSESVALCDGRTLQVSPDVQMDFRQMPFADETFRLVVFDPPHLNRVGPSSWTAAKYGALLPSWREDLAAGFAECFRVLKPGGTLVFKWSEVQIPLSRILELTDHKPLFGQRAGKTGKTHWVVFIKPEAAS